jgi:hypothetical protein
MNQTDIIRNSIIDKLITISNRDYLKAIYKIVDNSSVVADKIYLSAEQKIMLQLSENDIKENRIISETEMNKSDLKWLKEL